MKSNQQMVETAERVMLRNYRQPGFVLCKGAGSWVEDLEGRRYLDMSAGIAVCAIGHAHPKLARAIGEQAQRLMHVSNLFYNDQAIQLAAAIVDRAPFDRVYFCNSGAEAVEAVFKLSRRWHFEHGRPQRTKLVATEQSFHGRTYGALSLTGQPKYHAGLAPLVGDVQHVPYNDLGAMLDVVDDRTAAVLVEPIQAEGGLVVADDEYLHGLRQLCDERGALLLFDEVQTGYGRTGRFLAQQWSGVVPDACALAKGIGGGFPLGAMACTERVADGLPPGSHATTFGGNPLACAAGLAVLSIFDEEEVLPRVQQASSRLRERLEAMESGSVVELRGRGLLQGIRLAGDVDPAATMAAIRNEGVLLSVVGGDVLRISPPLNISDEDVDLGCRTIASVLLNPPMKGAVS